MRELEYEIYDCFDGTARLRLENLMVLKACNERAGTFMEVLEGFKLLPHTVSWCDDKGQTYRLYAVDEAYRGPITIRLEEMELVVASGVQNTCPIPSFRQAKSHWTWLPGKSLRERKPARLRGVSLRWFEALACFITWSHDHRSWMSEGEKSVSSNGEEPASRASQQ